ncbi:MAG TPA: transketolase [Candidatus Limnocylindria bacterium]|nr:transketolase [Candidatus Limnocylindria bacterium]
MEFTQQEIQGLRKRAAQLRGDLIEMIPAGKVGHLGGSSSIMDVVAALYFKVMKVFDDPKDPRRDILVFSKGHAVLAQYAALVELGYIDREALKHVKTLECVLQGHPDMDHTPGIEAVTGSLGQGLSICLGMALGMRLEGKDSRVYCVLGDGELAEGQVWEAAMAAAAYKADNLCAIVDDNGVQATAPTSQVLAIPAIRDKWAAFGWQTIEIDGHDMGQILNAFEQARGVKGKPTVILAKTVKGKGFSFAEGKAAYHNAAMNEDEYAQAKETVRRMLEEVQG